MDINRARTAECYHCGHTLRVAAAARTGTCPRCYRGLVLDDVVVSGATACASVRTCGRVVVKVRGAASAAWIDARAGVDVQGRLNAKVRTAGTVRTGPRGELVGDVDATGLVVEPGGTLLGYCRIGTERAPVMAVG